MAFKKHNGGIDFGQTPIENVFIREYLPNADGDQIKVYMAGLLYANEAPSFLFSDFAKSLGMTESYARKNLEYWERLGLVQIEKENDDFSISFNSIRALIYSNKIVYNLSAGNMEEKLAEKIVSVKGSRVNSREMSFLINYINSTENGYEIVENIITYFYKDHKGSRFMEMEKLLLDIRAKGITDIAEVLVFASINFRRKAFYKRVKKLITDNPKTTASEESIINQWLDDYNLSEEKIIELVKNESLGSTNPSFKYLKKVISSKFTKAKSIDPYENKYRQIKIDITGTRYAVTSAEKKLIRSWFEELKMTDEDLKNSISKFAPETKGATISYIDKSLRGESVSGTKKTRAKKVDRFTDSELEKLLMEKSRKKL